MDKLNQKPSIPTSQTLEKSHGSKIMLIIIGLVVVLIGVGGYVLLGINKSQTPLVNDVFLQPSPTPIDETAIWKKYVNTQYGFSVKSPGNWIVYGGDNGNVYKSPSIRGNDPSQMNLILPSKSCPLTYEMNLYDCGVKYEIVIVVKDNPKQLPLKEFGNAYVGEGAKGEYKSITIDNVKGLSGNYGESTTFVFLENNSKVYVIEYGHSGSIFNEILNTFKFTSP